MERNILNNKGVSVLEIAAVVFMAAIILSAVIPSYISRVNQAKYEETVKELTAIATACIDYYLNSNEAWPAGIAQLVPQFMPQVRTVSPFGTVYSIAPGNNMVTASVLVPAGIARNNPLGTLRVISNQGNQDLIAISQTIKNEFTGRLIFCNDYYC